LKNGAQPISWIITGRVEDGKPGTLHINLKWSTPTMQGASVVCEVVGRTISAPLPLMGLGGAGGPLDDITMPAQVGQSKTVIAPVNGMQALLTVAITLEERK
jgi:hypothetical protein